MRVGDGDREVDGMFITGVEGLTYPITDSYGFEFSIWVLRLAS